MIIVIGSLMTGCVATDQYGNVRPDHAQFAGAIAGVAAGALAASPNSNADRQPPEPYASSQRYSSAPRSNHSQRSGNNQQQSADNNPMNALMTAAMGQAMAQSTNKKQSKSKNKRITLPNGQHQPTGGQPQPHQIAVNGQKPNRPTPPQAGQPPHRIRPTE
ncbi:hypothetical protein HUU62_15690 [Rhodoferax sp. 4810]|uniref:Uncharacterized protein n=2 Tax=Thiospirillum jenense TaxID=1653858 RepID=A0A839HE61_9GAMM|nr:hypothetical protein [Rhodoferax jenense]MBB1126921.1 hypothetical protein [Thiospirillum jenense]